MVERAPLFAPGLPRRSLRSLLAMTVGRLSPSPYCRHPSRCCVSAIATTFHAPSIFASVKRS